MCCRSAQLDAEAFGGRTSSRTGLLGTAWTAVRLVGKPSIALGSRGSARTSRGKGKGRAWSPFSQPIGRNRGIFWEEERPAGRSAYAGVRITSAVNLLEDRAYSNLERQERLSVLLGEEQAYIGALRVKVSGRVRPADSGRPLQGGPG